MRRMYATLALALAVSVGCSDSGGDTTDFEGVIASDGLSGTISISVAGVVASVMAPSFSGAVTAIPTEPAAPVNVTGTLRVKGGSNVTLTGTFDTESKVLALTGSGYTFGGTFASGRLSGTFTGPGGAGLFTAFSRRSGEVELFCGDFTGSADGVWNLARNGNDLSGAFHETDGSSAGTLTGTLSGNNINLSFTGGTATGTLSGSSMSGTWTSTGSSGSWTGTKSGC
ncbi:MAG TPA: hypothetical protein VD793_10875 [Gemmatimonadales bacterium]|nr:hypothetical protein [Gemmatimonadales bacterium]